MANNNEAVSICNGELELLRIKADLFDDVVEFYKNNFMNNEPIHQAIGLADSDSVREDAAVIIRACLEDEVSFAVRKPDMKELVAVRICRILTPANDSCDFLCPAMSDLLRRLKTPFNIFKEWNIDCALEFSFLSTRNDYAGRGLGTMLSKYAIEFARKILNETLSENETLPAHIQGLKPKAVCSIFSSKFTQKMGDKLGMQVLVKVPYTEFFHEGKSYAERMDPIHECVTFVGMKL